MTEKSGVLILSASNYSAYSISVLQLLLDKGVVIRGILIQRLFDRDRFLRELKNSGFALFGKIAKKIFLQRLGVGVDLQDGFSAYFSTLEQQTFTLSELCKRQKIPYHFTSDFHSGESLEFIEKTHCALAAFTGGGLLREPVIMRAGLGVLNCHMGILPKYRGMDCTNWCALNRDYENIGFSIHLIDRGVDTGPIFQTHAVDVTQIPTVDKAVFQIEYEMAPAMADAIQKILRGDASFTPQDVGDGRQYFTLSPECLEISRKLFAKRA